MKKKDVKLPPKVKEVVKKIAGKKSKFNKTKSLRHSSTGVRG